MFCIGYKVKYKSKNIKNLLYRSLIQENIFFHELN